MYPTQPTLVPAPAQTKDVDASRLLRHAKLLNQLGQMYSRHADYLNALRCFNEALDIYAKHNDPKGRAVTLRHFADVHQFRD